MARELHDQAKVTIGRCGIYEVKQFQSVPERLSNQYCIQRATGQFELYGSRQRKKNLSL